MAPREPMRSLSDVPLPPVPRAEGAAGRSDLAPRPGHSSPSIPADGRAVASDPDVEMPFPPGAFSPDDAIDEQIADLERWAVANERREQSEGLRFWILRGVAFACAVLAAVSVQFGYTRASAIAAGVAAAFIAIDSAWPGSSGRNPYRRAVYDLRALQGTIKLKWDKVRLAYPNATGARRVANALALLDAIQAKREDIGRYLGSAEASPGVKRK
ncbi:MAG TPA: hypothetical protein VHU80_07600 [Polyangiaceae bacterium]|nr:hypothetical protein [Polyangiaceae bacterium]